MQSNLILNNILLPTVIFLGCPSSGIAVGSYCLWGPDDSASWNAASAACTAGGGMLAVFHTSEHLTAVRTTAASLLTE